MSPVAAAIAPIGTVSGADRNTAQQITRQPPSSRDERAALRVADRGERDGDQDLHVAGAHARALCRREREHRDEPGQARNPEAAEGRSPARRTATTAVAAGSTPTITALCAEVRPRSANA